MSKDHFGNWLRRQPPKPPYYGPPPDEGSACVKCQRAAVAKRDGCGGNFCPKCWNRHSHTTKTGMDSA